MQKQCTRSVGDVERLVSRATTIDRRRAVEVILKGVTVTWSLAARRSLLVAKSRPQTK
jgi:hypothetical protein